MGECPVAKHFDYWDNDALKDPFPIYEEMRATCPVTRSEEHGGFWIASRYAEIAEVTHDYKTYLSGEGVSVPAFPTPYSLYPVETDKPLHDEYRRILYARLRPGEMQKFEPTVRRLTNRLIDEFIEDGSCEIHQAMAAPLVAMTIGPFLGLSETEWPRLTEAAYDMLYSGNPEEASQTFFAFMEEQFEERRKHPGDDLMSELLTVEIEDDGVMRPLTKYEQMSMAWSLVQASNDTTAGMVVTAMWHLAQHPELRARFVEDPSLIEANLDEFVRLFTCVTVSRTVAADTTLGDEQLKPGDKLVILLGSANRDPEQFEQPDEFVFDRSPNKHLGFGQGIHKCLGLHMARMEFKVMLEEVLRRMPDYAIGEGEILTNAGAAWQMRSMPIVFTPGVREA
jgi:cytochrome P450